MSVLMYTVGLTEPGVTDKAGLQEELEKQGVVFGIDWEKIDAQLEAEIPESECVIARGERARDGKNGFVKYHIDVSAKPMFIPDEEENLVDYRKAVRVALVEKGSIIAELVPPTHGETGTNVCGTRLAPNPGAPARIGVGEGVEQKGSSYFATCSGTPSNRNEVLVVKQVYEVQGNVDFSTGNIEFPGSVIINGSVQDGFEIRCEENLVVRGTILAAKVQVRGNLQALGGILGKGKAMISTGGFVEAKFVDAAQITAEGDVAITKDVVHSQISTLGSLRVGGGIIGGEIMALHEVEVVNIGSQSGTKTLIQFRKHYKQEKARQLSEEILTEAFALGERCNRFLHQDDLNGDDLKGLDEAIEMLEALLQKKRLIDAKIEKLETTVAEIKDSGVRVNGVIHPDVLFVAPHCRQKTMDPIKGPITVVEHMASGGMNFAR